MSSHIEKLCVIGCGLMGASAAAALKKRSPSTYIEAIDIRLNDNACPHAAGKYRDLADRGWIDAATDDIGAALESASALLIAVPLHQYRRYLDAFTPSPDLLITDVGSAKQCVLDFATGAWGAASEGFVPAHPIAGATASGHQHADPDLYEGSSVFLTPHPDCADWSIGVAEYFWRKLGAGHVEYLSAEAHDRLLARTSHLPQLLAYSLARAVAKRGEDAGFASACGPGARTSTGLGESGPGIWADICRWNRANVLAALDELGEETRLLREYLEAEDDQSLERYFAGAVTARKRIADARPGLAPASGQDDPDPDAGNENPGGKARS